MKPMAAHVLGPGGRRRSRGRCRPLAFMRRHRPTCSTQTGRPRDLAHSRLKTSCSRRLPARAPVQKERIETEMRTASGILDERWPPDRGRCSHHGRLFRRRQILALLCCGQSHPAWVTTLLRRRQVCHRLEARPDGLDVHFFDARPAMSAARHWRGRCRRAHASSRSACPARRSRGVCRLAALASRTRCRKSCRFQVQQQTKQCNGSRPPASKDRA